MTAPSLLGHLQKTMAQCSVPTGPLQKAGALLRQSNRSLQGRGVHTHMQASVPLGNTSHFPPFKQVSPGWEQRRPGEGQEERSARPAPPGALSTLHLLSLGLLGAGGPQEALHEPQGDSTFCPEFWGQSWGGVE